MTHSMMQVLSCAKPAHSSYQTVCTAQKSEAIANVDIRMSFEQEIAFRSPPNWSPRPSCQMGPLVLHILSIRFKECLLLHESDSMLRCMTSRALVDCVSKTILRYLCTSQCAALLHCQCT